MEPVSNKTIEGMVELLQNNMISREVYDRFMVAYTKSKNTTDLSCRRYRTKWSSGLDNALTHLYTSGMSLHLIADVLHVTHDAVRHRREVLNIPIRTISYGPARTYRYRLTDDQYDQAYTTPSQQRKRKRPTKESQWTPEVEERLLKLYTVGRTIKDISKTLDLRYSDVCLYTQKLNVNNNVRSRNICLAKAISTPDTCDLSTPEAIDQIKLSCMYHSIEATTDECRYGKPPPIRPLSPVFNEDALPQLLM